MRSNYDVEIDLWLNALDGINMGLYLNCVYYLRHYIYILKQFDQQPRHYSFLYNIIRMYNFKTKIFDFLYVTLYDGKHYSYRV